jgi:hypothetical protein
MPQILPCKSDRDDCLSESTGDNVPKAKWCSKKEVAPVMATHFQSPTDLHRIHDLLRSIREVMGSSTADFRQEGVSEWLATA